MTPAEPGTATSRASPGPAEIVRHDRRLTAASLLLLAGLAWLYLWYDADGMAGGLAGSPSGRLMVLSLRDAWGWPALGLGLLMWLVMMAGMMLPGALPAILLYARLWRQNRARGAVLPSVWIFLAGYAAVWGLFCVGAVLLQAALQARDLLDPMLQSSQRWLSAGLLLAAGAYQLLPLKRVCLRHCQAPLQFFMTHWRSGRLGAWRMGASHGLFCLGCCWALMLLLFVAGAMNLAWVAALAAFVLAEKLLPARWRLDRAAGLLLLAAGAALLLAR